MKKLQFEATPYGNVLHTLDNTIRACVEVPEGASDDYGYMAMKNAILKAYHGTEPLEFWYDGQEAFLNPDACEGEPIVEIETEDNTMAIREFVATMRESSPDYDQPMDIETAAIDLANFAADGIDLPDGITPETYAETWNAILNED